MATPQYVRDLSLTGQFDAIGDGPIQNVIDRVVLLYKSVVPEDLYVPVVGLHTAHLLVGLLAQQANGVAQGPLASAKVDKLEKRWAAPAVVVPGPGLDDTTSYGRECKRLLRSRLPSLRATY